jgi:nucleoside-diphosphate-sugar epimerase
MKVLVTGAAGNLGSATVRGLAAGGGFELRACDQNADPSLPVRCEVVNLLDRESCYRLLEGMDAFVHFANHPNFLGGNAQRIFNENVAMNMNVFQAAAELGVRKVIFASSIQTIIGDRKYRDDGEQDPSTLQYLPLDGDAPANPGNPYALSKVVSEQMLRYFAAFQSMSCVAIRFPGVVLEAWWDRSRKFRGIPTGRGGGWTPFLDEAWAYLHVDDAVSLVAACLRADLPGYRAYLPSARTPRIDMPVPQIVERFFPKVALRKPVGELTGLIDISRIERETAWAPTRDLSE